MPRTPFDSSFSKENAMLFTRNSSPKRVSLAGSCYEALPRLCLHMWQAGSLIEKDLRQLSSFFYCELVGSAPEETSESSMKRTENSVL